MDSTTDPDPGEREYYTHRQTGDLGWLVIRDGRQCIKLDRPGYDDIRPFSEDAWAKRVEPKPIIRNQAAQVAWAADRILLQFLGKPDLAKVKWIEMTEQKRIAWVASGPQTKGMRKRLYDAIMATLEPITEKQ